jgi:hypothetical protein
MTHRGFTVTEVKMAPQLSRILLVFAGIVFMFLAFRSQAVPDGFGEDGFYRKQGPAVVAAHELKHAGIDACKDCHPDKIDATPHVKKGVHCESCHGPAAKHVEDWEASKPKVMNTRADCARCHGMIVGRPDWYPQIDPKEHNPDGKCVDCHEVHPATDAEEAQR